jgi:hypothetical protein
MIERRSASVNIICPNRRMGMLDVGPLLRMAVLLAISMILIGCKKVEKDIATIVDEVDKPNAIADLTDIVDRRVFPIDFQRRASMALLKLKNETLDTQPIVIFGVLMSEANETDLMVKCFDEGRDLRGIRIRERQTDANGVVTTLEEDYPVYIDQVKSPTLEDRPFPDS